MVGSEKKKKKKSRGSTAALGLLLLTFGMLQLLVFRLVRASLVSGNSALTLEYPQPSRKAEPEEFVTDQCGRVRPT